MNKIISLLKATMSQDMDLFKLKNKNESVCRKILLPIILSLIVMFSIGSYAVMFAEELAPNHLTYIILTIFVIITSLLTLIEGIYKSQSILFEAKDNDLLFSLPISKQEIFFTRIFKLVTFQLLYNSLFMLPAIIVYAMYEKPNVSFYLISFIMLLVLPIIPTIISCIIGYIIKGITSKFKCRNIIQVILTSFILLLIFYISFNIQNLIANVVQKANSINEVITEIYYPAGLYINLIHNFNIIDLVILLGINFIPATLFIYIASISYFKITSKLTENRNGYKKYDNKKYNKKFVLKPQLYALVSKEIKRFFSTPIFIINAGFGILLMVVITIGMSINLDEMLTNFIKENGIQMSISEIKIIIPKIYYELVVFTSCMTCITSSMISLEGKSFNITKSLPVKIEKILLSKVIASNIISIPIILICDIIFFISFKVAILDILFIILASFIMPTFTALVGVLINLKYPKMNATSDTEVVKQSMSAMICVFIGMFIGMLSVTIIMIGNKTNLFIILELFIFSIITFILYKILKKYGVKRFKEINI